MSLQCLSTPFRRTVLEIRLLLYCASPERLPPAGVDVAALPQDYRDYVRAALSRTIATMDVTLGIDLPNEAERSALPTGITDYIR